MYNTRLYMPSTPFNLLLSYIDAISREGECVLVYIDQKSETPYLETLSSLVDTPFKEVCYLFAKEVSRKKLKERKNNFLKLDKLILKYSFQEIVVGSDRRIEFQYLMNKLIKQKVPVKGSYLDDGLYSYLPWKRTRLQHLLNSITKKIVYGFWWDEPVMPGCSRYIHQSILINAPLALSALKNRDIIELDLKEFSSDRLQTWAKKLFTSFKFNISRVTDIDVFFILPHPNDFKKMPGYLKSVEKNIENKLSLGKKIAIKYHPKFNKKDPFNLSQHPNIELIPSSLAFEFILPFLKKGTSIIGNFTTVMLTSKILRKDLNVIANISSSNAYEMQLVELMNKFNIQIVDK